MSTSIMKVCIYNQWDGKGNQKKMSLQLGMKHNSKYNIYKGLNIQNSSLCERHLKLFCLQNVFEMMIFVTD